MKYLLLLLLFLPLFADTYPSFSKHELIKIKKEHPVAYNRILDYTDYVQSCKENSKKIQLNKINFYLNRLLPQYDDVVDKELDHWATPKEFLTVGYGDCEDYAIIKYYSLIKLGFDKKKLFITIVKENFRGGEHMVLCYFKTKNRPPLVLDNLSFKILTLQKRKDLTAQYFINSTGIYKMKDNFTLHKVSRFSTKFQTLQKNVQNNH